MKRFDPLVRNLDTTVYTIPTDGPDGRESDGTLQWSSTTLVVVEIQAGGRTGMGYTYAEAAAGDLVASKLKPAVMGKNPLEIGAVWMAQMAALRNAGRPGAGAMALSAVDIALWDLKAQLLDLPLYRTLNPFHAGVPVYGSGGFCNYPLDRLADQVAAWADEGLPAVKIKTSRHPSGDPERLAACRAALGEGVVLMADANGALSRKEALYWGRRFRAEWGVAWFEEPVSSEDRAGLRLLRDQGPPGLEIAAGEYGFVLRDFRDLLEAGAVDCLQADVTRCGGITGLLQVGGLCAAHHLDLSAHCAPSVSAHAFCGIERRRHLEYFHDHVRIERMAFDGALSPKDGVLRPDPTRPGLGLTLKRKDMEGYKKGG